MTISSRGSASCASDALRRSANIGIKMQAAKKKRAPAMQIGLSGGITRKPSTCEVCQKNGVTKSSAAAESGENALPDRNTDPMPTRIVAVARSWRDDGRSPTTTVERISEYTG